MNRALLLAFLLLFNSPVQAEKLMKSIQTSSAVEFCALLSSPSDILFRHSTQAQRREFLYYGTIIEALNGKIPLLRYGHTEVVSAIVEGQVILTRSFFPRSLGDTDSQIHFVLDPKREILEGQMGEKDYVGDTSDDLSIYRKQGTIQERELALSRVALDLFDSEGFTENGVCSDWANWVHGDFAKGRHEYLPYIGKILKKYYPIARIQTPEQLAQAPETKKICSIEKTKLIYPKSDVTIMAEKFVNEVMQMIASVNVHLHLHGDFLMRKLQDEGIVDEKGKVLVKQFQIKRPT